MSQQQTIFTDGEKNIPIWLFTFIYKFKTGPTKTNKQLFSEWSTWLFQKTIWRNTMGKRILLDITVSCMVGESYQITV